MFVGNLQEVPGIGDVGEKKLKEAGITTTFSLMGKYLMLKDEGVGTVENADRMYYFLQSIDYPAGFRGKQYFSRQSHIHICNHSRRHTFCIYIAGVVHAIAEKLNIKFPGIYDADAYSS